MKVSNPIKLISSLLLSAALSSGIVLLQKPRVDLENKFTNEDYQRLEEREKATASLLKQLPSFGYDNLIADWAYLKFLVYFGDTEARDITGYAATPDYFETVVKNDPRFIKAYFPMSPATSVFAGRPELSTNLIEKGLQKITPQTSPDSYFLWIYKAVDEVLFLGDSQAAKNSYEMAAKWADIVNDDRSKAVGNRAKVMAKFLKDKPNSIEAQIGSWFQLLTNARDKATRQKAINNIEALGGEITITPDGRVRVTVPEEHRRS
ncbi:hypothetical protein [Myxosarcina sp. GI1(2024)]